MTSPDTAHQEKHFESYVISKLAALGWKVGETTHYDTERALYPEDVVSWLEGLCCTNQKRAEITQTPDAATPQQEQAPLPGAQVV